MVLHDINQALRYSERVIALKDGRIFADGATDEVLTEENFRALYGVSAIKTTLCRNGDTYPVFVLAP
jgi:iron complex transport system ATP-binding protein